MVVEGEITTGLRYTEDVCRPVSGATSGQEGLDCTAMEQGVLVAAGQAGHVAGEERARVGQTGGGMVVVGGGGGGGGAAGGGLAGGWVGRWFWWGGRAGLRPGDNNRDPLTLLLSACEAGQQAGGGGPPAGRVRPPSVARTRVRRMLGLVCGLISVWAAYIITWEMLQFMLGSMSLAADCLTIFGFISSHTSSSSGHNTTG